MDETIVYLSDESRLKAFEHSWAKLEGSTTQLNLDALSLCIRLLPPFGPDTTEGPHQKLRRLLVHRLPEEPQDAEHLYKLAETCAANESFARLLFVDLHRQLSAAACQLSGARKEEYEYDGQTVSADEYTRRTATILASLKCSFWLPRERHHVLNPDLFKLLTDFVGLEGLTEIALDALSALLSLLSRRQQEPIFVANPGGEVQWLKFDSTSGRLVLNQSVIDQSLWTCFKTLSPTFFGTKSSNLFKVWFQWVSQAVTDGLDVDGVYEELYWDRVRTGLLTGFADQRKYCLGIIRASLLAAQKDIDTKAMRLQVGNKDAYITAYERYFILYETIVLDRYANQIEACLSELSTLFGSRSEVTSTMATTLLSSALDPQVQEGIRKIVGNWYFGFIGGVQSPLSKDIAALDEHTRFLVEGFLPWATQGSLFTSTLKPTRTGTDCVHGAALVNVVARFITSKHSSEDYRPILLDRILSFVLDAGGRMFQISTLYLLEGLIKGYEEVARIGSKSTLLGTNSTPLSGFVKVPCLITMR